MTSRFNSQWSRRLALLLVAVALLVLSNAAFADTGSEVKEASPAGGETTPFTTISSSGPLEQIYVGIDASYQISYTLSGGQVYPPEGIPGDFGTLVAVGDTLYAPDFDNHSDGTATGNLGTYTVFTPVSQSAVMGSGTEADPYRVVTVVDVGTTGLRLTHTDSYVTGTEWIRSEIVVTNTGNDTRTLQIYRAMDCFLGGSDSGYGVVNPATGAVGCSENANNEPPALIEQFTPLTPGSTYYHARYSQVWAQIATREPLPNTCRCDEAIDNGIAISWSLTLAGGGAATVAHYTTFSPTGKEPPPTAVSLADVTGAPARSPLLPAAMLLAGALGVILIYRRRA
jgi:hypothetical protein